MANGLYIRFDDDNKIQTYPLHHLNLNDQFNTYRSTYQKENKEANQEN